MDKINLYQENGTINLEDFFRTYRMISEDTMVLTKQNPEYLTKAVELAREINEVIASKADVGGAVIQMALMISNTKLLESYASEVNANIDAEQATAAPAEEVTPDGDN